MKLKPQFSNKIEIKWFMQQPGFAKYIFPPWSFTKLLKFPFGKRIINKFHVFDDLHFYRFKPIISKIVLFNRFASTKFRSSSNNNSEIQLTYAWSLNMSIWRQLIFVVQSLFSQSNMRKQTKIHIFTIRHRSRHSVSKQDENCLIVSWHRFS